MKRDESLVEIISSYSECHFQVNFIGGTKGDTKTSEVQLK